MSAAPDATDLLCINTMRTLAMDAVQAANSGHPGTPVSLSPVVYTLWQRILKYDPADPIWPNRDRFVLSAGHASLLLYTALHLAGVKKVEDEKVVLDEPAVTLDNIKKFRQLNSVCAGHPEYRFCSGVETTTGPLGNGVATSVGMAIASKWLAATYNKPGFDTDGRKLFDFNVFSVAGDGCMQEGISHEAAALAGHLKLNNLCWVYDSNRITIEGETSLSMSEDVGARYAAYGWNVIRLDDANDISALEAAFNAAKATTDKPTFILVKSHIAWGVPGKQDHHSAHGEPLGPEAIKGAKKNYGWPEDAQFLVPDGVMGRFQDQVGKKGKAASDAWKALFAEYKSKYPELATQIEIMNARGLPTGWDAGLPTYAADPKGKASREVGGEVLNALAKNIPWIIGGSADLAPSTKTRLTFKEAGDFQAGSYGGRNMHFGIREHAMSAAINGMSLCRLRSYGSGFLIFSDYGRTPIRLAALMEIPVAYVFTHDSLGVGEDGPTHQPIEQLINLRSVPNLVLIRPGDANEVVEAWKTIVQQTHESVVLILSRQAMPTLDRTKYAPAAEAQKGAYVLACNAPDGKPEVILMATGTELGACVEAYEKLVAEGVKARIVSMPSWELFEHHCSKHPEYRDKVFPCSSRARVSYEMASTLGWAKYVGLDGISIGIDRFGASAPLKDLLKFFGFTSDAIVKAAKESMEKCKKK